MYYFQIVIALAAWICVCRGQNPNTTPVPSPSNYPFMASVQRLGAQERTGIILDASHILTTARRIETIYYRDYRVFVGQLDWADNDEAVSQVRNVSQVLHKKISYYIACICWSTIYIATILMQCQPFHTARQTSRLL